MRTKNIHWKPPAAKLLAPLMGSAFPREAFAPIDLSVKHTNMQPEGLQSFKGLEAFVKRRTQETSAKVLWGGYLERRQLYRQSAHFGAQTESRDIHLGIDLWQEAGCPVYAPFKGIVHSLQYNDNPLDYGATLIVEHHFEQKTFFTLYGHIQQKDLQIWKPGDRVPTGALLCHLGAPHENGGWVPHLHFQIILDMEGKQGDYPGVARVSEKAYFSNNCPNPLSLIIPLRSTDS